MIRTCFPFRFLCVCRGCSLLQPFKHVQTKLLEIITIDFKDGWGDQCILRIRSSVATIVSTFRLVQTGQRVAMLNCVWVRGFRLKRLKNIKLSEVTVRNFATMLNLLNRQKRHRQTLSYSVVVLYLFSLYYIRLSSRTATHVYVWLTNERPDANFSYAKDLAHFQFVEAQHASLTTMYYCSKAALQWARPNPLNPPNLPYQPPLPQSNLNRRWPVFDESWRMPCLPQMLAKTHPQLLHVLAAYL